MEEEFGIIGRSPAIQRVLSTINQVAPTDISVLISGESGTGKELVARAIHVQSRRKEMPWVVVNCGAIPEGILESELFGHEKGAFTGAVGSRKGYFELADAGTIFLDEIGEMPLGTQVKLLRVLEGKEFMKVGGTKSQHVDVRIIAATNKDLERAVRAEEFREDLYYRLNAVNLRMPPLRERREDIPLLIKRFTSQFCKEHHIEFEGFTESALSTLENYSWPGNVRELKNLVQSVIVLEKGHKVDEFTISNYLQGAGNIDRNLPVPTHRTSEQVEREFVYHALLDLKAEISKLREDIYHWMYSENRPKSLPYYSEVFPRTPDTFQESENNSDLDLENRTLAEIERHMINRALENHDGSKRKAAKSLGISERTLYRKIKEYDLPY
ncbi:sigma-54-dependent Fis family transcriptional regulator [candidate division KSB1 bacterium]|nr:sigma-54-dependent Fis family transcriptional regulator [candidate division KSB1 bacterium]NIR72439.1 sigma-54-dependent Fis family transcriptional regulator [candidate division KSB1 bacterium]NIS23936.1 sigma-54-dependent Fis family transcriptional regulator [candidate division KSB1 bacterium]NIT70853.1 sigma-54-dependent Fis family transcriptional regulator [candidate division KSB1 bacterium]NIU24584.1 sigma-54-dependent Fis family transcriptional regulator [candidate division KSB1 bacteri